GTNDAAVITGSSTGAITETNAIQSVGGTLTVTDVDAGQSSFVAQTNVAGSNGYGKFTINAAGAWTYTMDTAHNEFVGGQTYTDSITVTTADGTTQVITVTMTGTNDAAEITGTSTGAITETNAVQSVGGTLTVIDEDIGQSAFVAQTNVAGSNGYGKFTINAAGVWTYTMDTAHNEFVGGQNYTDSITVVTADGTTQVITVTMTGTNDAAVITGTSTGAITESNAIQSVGGTLAATDVDSSAAFVAQTNVAGNNGYGKFTINAAGVWTYVMDTAHNEFVAGQTYTDSITVTTADGTTQVITVTITGTNDAAVIGNPTVATVTEDTSVSGGNLTATGSITITDADTGQSSFNTTVTPAGGNLGTLVLAANGTYTYTVANSAVQYLAAGATKVDQFTITSVDGTSKVISFTINGTNDVPVIGGVSTGTVKEDTSVTSGNIATGGTLTISDADTAQSTFTPQASYAGTYGTFTLSAAGVWTYTANNSHAAIQALGAGQSLTDSFTAVSSDGTANQVVTVTINGTNDAAVITGSSTGAITETNAIQSVGGTLTVTDVDAGQSSFVAQTNV
ncbi:VCBS domain-containing protein, partial [Methylocaldum sp.]|uniref:VCBS domain-containing protein n=1 Tax=Methylocaldum sp. TaxID=1969727 RepID=UPI002D409D29